MSRLRRVELHSRFFFITCNLKPGGGSLLPDILMRIKIATYRRISKARECPQPIWQSPFCDHVPHLSCPCLSASIGGQVALFRSSRLADLLVTLGDFACNDDLYAAIAGPAIRGAVGTVRAERPITRDAPAIAAGMRLVYHIEIMWVEYCSDPSAVIHMTSICPPFRGLAEPETGRPAA